ncbi:MAG: hypothetical protein JOY81_11165 [Alphaproteobacteria bacterium]|nr:hypothetical protein [Alphaproteobacteria bacterium]
MPLRAFRFEHPKTEQSITLRRTSYLWAGLFGAGYVAWVGYGNVARAAIINLGFAIGSLALIGVTSSKYVVPKTQLVVLLIAAPLVIWIQGELMVSIIRTGFRRRGWLTRRPD